MAKVLGGIGSNLSGKLENTVFVNSPWGTYVRKAPHYKKDSWNPRQTAARGRFAAINRYLGQFKYSVIPQIWKQAAVRMSGHAYFLKTNMPAFGADGSLADAKMLLLSTGKLSFPESFEVKRSQEAGNRIEVSWPREMHVGGVQLKAELMVISAGQGLYSDILVTDIKRGDLNGSFELPVLEAEAAYLYLFFGAKDRQDYSSSMCFEI